MPRTLLARGADVLITMEGERREIHGGGIYVEGGAIVAVGATADLPTSAEEMIGSGCWRNSRRPAPRFGDREDYDLRVLTIARAQNLEKTSGAGPKAELEPVLSP